MTLGLAHNETHLVKVVLEKWRLGYYNFFCMTLGLVHNETQLLKVVVEEWRLG